MRNLDTVLDLAKVHNVAEPHVAYVHEDTENTVKEETDPCPVPGPHDQIESHYSEHACKAGD